VFLCPRGSRLLQILHLFDLVFGLHPLSGIAFRIEVAENKVFDVSRVLPSRSRGTFQNRVADTRSQLRYTKINLIDKLNAEDGIEWPIWKGKIKFSRTSFHLRRLAPWHIIVLSLSSQVLDTSPYETSPVPNMMKEAVQSRPISCHLDVYPLYCQHLVELGVSTPTLAGYPQLSAVPSGGHPSNLSGG